MKHFKPFNAETVALQGSNLIEASAGTGKTYSIAIIVLRLILEKKLSVKEILMVTFTKAAVAELEERVRLFIRNAYKASQGEHINDTIISNIVNRYPDKIEAQKLLQEAVLFLDETSVLTIHSFCQKTLNEFAFETNQLFGTETLQDVGSVIATEINKYWRSNITSIPTGLLEQLLEGGLSRDNIAQIVREHLSGKKYFQDDFIKTAVIKKADYTAIEDKLKSLKNKITVQHEEIENYIIKNAANLKSISEKNSFAKKNVLGLIDHPKAFIQFINQSSAVYIQKLFGEIIDQLEPVNKNEEERNQEIRKVVKAINRAAIHAVSNGILAYKLRNNQMSFDDMIVKLHEALIKPSADKLVTELQKKYKAVFVDEFQDTDRLQYEIFQKAFNSNTILFYIGDPKQSIYAWRKADIFTYFKAYDEVDHIYDMNQNFRSSEPMINAMNIFFKPTVNFDTFAFNNASHAIEYIPVKAPAGILKAQLHDGPTPVVPITISELLNNDQVNNATVAQVIDLLENKDYAIGQSGSLRPITPADIGILVKTNHQGRVLKNKLSMFGIPAVTIADEKILQSEEATYLLYLLQAMAEISRAGINKALLSPFTGFTVKEILQLNDEKTLELFKKYKSRWVQDGIYTALIDFVSDFNVQQVLLQHNTENGERIITNLFHLIELVHKIQTAKLLSPAELISWLKRGIEGMETEGDEFEQRVESDEEAVRIVTIHRSKGLEYKIVLSPFMDFAEMKNETICSFRDEATGDYISIEKKLMTPEQALAAQSQMEQEFRRLLYVAITRSVYKCYIFRNTYYKTSTLSIFTNALKTISTNLIETIPALEIPEKYRYSKAKLWQPQQPLGEVHFTLAHQNWTRMSYTMLAAKPEHKPRWFTTLHADEFEHFVFYQLEKGERTGNLLHYIFENIHYTQTLRWTGIIEAAIARFAPRHKLAYQQLLQNLILQVLQTDVQIQNERFKLESINYNKRIHEFEFDFPVHLFRSESLEQLSDDDIQVNIKMPGNIEGIMNGKIDLFFEHEGKYYILDWKSNYLGDSLQNYSPAALSQAMNDNNYHLQYLIYTLAVTKYLQSRLPGFNYEKHFGGVIYVFVRGVRRGSNTGMYTARPSLQKMELLQNILQGEAVVDQL